MERKIKRWILWLGRLVVPVIYLVFFAYAVIASIAFVLKIVGANANTDFAEWIYEASDSIVQPFRGIFPVRTVSESSTFDASLVFAAASALVLAVILHGIVDWFSRQIAGVDRVAEREETLRALELQREQQLAAFGGGVSPAAAPLAPTTMWDHPPVGTPSPPPDPWTSTGPIGAPAQEEDSPSSPRL